MSLRLHDQLCFPLYAASRAIQQRYQPLLKPLGLTYPQYLVMLVLWEQDGLSVNDIGRKLWLDSGTLTPLLKRMEASGLLLRKRAEHDGRVMLITLTEAGQGLEQRAASVPGQLVSCLDGGSPEELVALKRQLDGLLRLLRG